mmetsp:Transcript_11165/g.35040  ORF Transcript_11165/g.35040 Transcript_11165/m.35040 type:complete len:366 (-) Transcript_11165:49-1146(-)
MAACAPVVAAPAAVAVGSPMLDTMVRVSEDFLAQHALPKGDATAVMDRTAFDRLKAEAAASSPQPAATGCGGCATNTAKVLAALGSDAALCGCLGRDEAAARFRKGFEACGMRDATVEAGAAEGGAAAETGEVLCLVTPDGERTFVYRPGASAALTVAGLSSALQRFLEERKPRELGLVYFDVYTLLCPGQLTEDGMRQAKALGARCGLNLGSAGIVSAQRARLWALLRAGLCDVLTMNGAEAQALCSGEGQEVAIGGPQEALERVAGLCELAVLTLGADGLWTAGRDLAPERFSVEPVADIVDTTGAGDYFAGGFLAARLRGLPLPLCAAWGAAAAAEVLQVFSADLDTAAWARLRERCHGMLR